RRSRARFRPAPPATIAPGAPHAFQLFVRFGGRTVGDSGHQHVERLQHPLPFDLAALPDPGGVVMNGLPHDLALRLEERLRGLPQARRGLLVEAEGHLHCHTLAILPYYWSTTRFSPSCLPRRVAPHPL